MVGIGKTLLRGAGLIFFFGILSSGLGYLLRVVLAQKLGTEEYGLFFAVYNAVLLIGWIKGFGFGSSMQKFIPEYAAQGKQEEVKGVLTFILLFTIISSIIFLAAAVFFPASIMNGYFQHELGKKLLLLMLGFMLIDDLARLLSNYFLAVKRYTWYAAREPFLRLLVLGGLLLLPHFSVLTIGLLYGGAGILGLMVSTFLFLRHFPFFQYASGLSKDLLRKMFSFSLPMLLQDSFSILMARIDTLSLTYFRPLTEVAIYNVLAPTADMLLLFARPFGRILFPLSSELSALGQKEKIASALRTIQEHLLMILVPGVLFFLFFSKELLLHLFGEEYAVGALGLQILAASFILNSFNMINYSVLLGLGHPKQGTVSTLFSNLLNLLLNIGLIPWFATFSSGFLGAIVATVISSLALWILLQYHLQRFLLFRFSWQQGGKIIGAGALTAAVAWISMASLNNLIAQVAVFGVLLLTLYPLLLFLFQVTSWEKVQKLWKMVREKRK